MADIRELLILNSRFVSTEESAVVRVLGNLRMVVRRFALRTARYALVRSLYLQVYRFHIWVARKLVLRFLGTRSLYLSAGVGRGEIRPGISDIDMVILGDWPEKTQINLLKSLAVTILIFPLFDRESLGSIQTWHEFLKTNQTDLLLAYHYASAKRNWKLEWGEDLIQQLPDLSAERRAGAGYLEVRRWWSVFAGMALGRAVTSRDAVFRNTLSYKAVADVLRAELVARNILPPKSRNALLREGLRGEDAPLRDRLLASEASSFLSMSGDIRQDAAQWLVQRIEQMHAWLPAEESFAAVAVMRLEGTADDRLIANESNAHIGRMVQSAASLGGLRAAYLTHGAGFIMPDTLALLLEFEAGQVPSIESLRSFLAPHLDVVGTLPQRVALYLLLEHGAYILDPVYGLEFWGTLLMPQANPDVFASLADPGFCLWGSPRPPRDDLRWSRVSQELLEEELAARRGALKRFGIVSRPTSADNLRNLWRFLQLLLMARRTADGEVLVPAGIASTCRDLSALAPELATDLLAMEKAMLTAVNGGDVEVGKAMQRVYDWAAAHDISGPEAYRLAVL